MAKAKNKIKAVIPELVDPRQGKFIAFYTDPKSETYSNAYQSAVCAGYAPQYAESITSQRPKWLPEALSEALGNKRKVELAKKHIDEVLGIPILVQAMGAFGPLVKKIPTGKFHMVRERGKKKKVKREIMDEEPIMVYAPSLIKEKTKVTEMALEALDAATYGKKPRVGFNFNFTADRGRYA